MSTSLETAAPPIEQLASDMIAALCLAARAYLDKEDVDAAVTACDIAGPMFERLSTRLRPDDRVALSELVTDLRLTIVRKRGGS